MKETTHIIVTVDVEDFFQPRPPTDMVFAKIGKEYYGITKIMDILEAHGTRGTFFVDVYNRETLDEGLIREACQEIHRRGHQVGLHTHPPKRPGMKGAVDDRVMINYSLEEQIEIVRRGKQWIEKWIGVSPTCHRAGSYGADLNTLDALKANSIPVDASLFWGKSKCWLCDDNLPIRNMPGYLNGIFEIPTTVTRNVYYLHVCGKRISLASLTKKLDPNWCSLSELQEQVKVLRRHGIDPLVLFLHSYSFVSIANDYTPAAEVEARFRELMSWLVSQPECQFVTAEGFYHLWQARKTGARDVIPPVYFDLGDYTLQDWKGLYFDKIRMRINTLRMRN